jgi:hypothetical protein
VPPGLYGLPKVDRAQPQTGLLAQEAQPPQIDLVAGRGDDVIGRESALLAIVARESQLYASVTELGIAHTHTHPVLTSLPPHLAQEEIRKSKEELEQILGRPVLHFAYPFGMRRHFNDALRAYCRSIGFRTIANAIPGMQYAPSRADALHRSVWFLEQPFAFNLANVCVDGRLFEMVTGRSAVGGNAS